MTTTSPHKIGLVTPFFLPQIGGANLYCFELARALGRMGHDVHVFTVEGALDDDAYTLHPILTKNLKADIKALEPYDMDIWHALFFFYAPLALHKKNVTITGHGDDCFTFQLRLPLPARMAIETRFAWRLPPRLYKGWTQLSHKLEIGYNVLVNWLALLRAHHIVTVSSFTRKRLLQRYPFARWKTTVVPPGVSERFFQPFEPAPKKNSRFDFLTVCRLDEEDRIKNVHGVIEALGALKEYDFTYHIVSGTEYGSYREELTSMVSELGLEDKVIFEGRKSDEELLELYRSSDLFILVSYAEPNNFEGFGIVFLEANACGAPVLTSRDGGMADYVVEGENGFYVDDPSGQAIRRALQRFMDGEIDFDRETIRSYPEPYRWHNIASRIFSLYG